MRTGRTDDLTPNGNYTIQNKKKDPTWRRPGDGKEFKPGDPENELGTRWMSFWKDRLGIHGTIKPETVGLYSSAGCARLMPEEVEELYDLVVRATPVDIVEVFTPPQGGGAVR